MDREELQRRLRAARGYAGLSLDDAAEKVGFGRNTLVRIENGERDAKRMELRELAAAYGLPYEFFTVDLSRLAQLESDHEDMAQQIAAEVYRLLSARFAKEDPAGGRRAPGQPGQEPPPIGEDPDEPESGEGGSRPRGE